MTDRPLPLQHTKVAPHATFGSVSLEVVAAHAPFLALLVDVELASSIRSEKASQDTRGARRRLDFASSECTAAGPSLHTF